MSKESPQSTPIQHHEITPATDPSRVKLPPGFSVCVIGASRGIGAGVAYAYAQAGASTIVIAARSVGSLETVAAKCKEIQPSIKVQCEHCDITQNESVAALAQRISEEVRRLDVVVVNSGFSGPVVPKVTEGDPADFKTCFDINTIGTYLAAHHLLPILLQSEGVRSFLVVSTAGTMITDGPIANPGYCISKLAQLRLVEMIANAYEDEGLLAVGIHPGAVVTEMSKDAPEVFKPYLIDSVDLCGGYCVWLTKDTKATSWLNGRFVAATWDADQLASSKDEVLEQNLLKFGLRRGAANRFLS